MQSKVSISFLTILFIFSQPFASAENFSCEPTSLEEKAKINKLHILYLLQTKEFQKGIDLYFDYKQTLGQHDFEILQQMALIILEKGARSPDTEEQIKSIYGSSIAGITAAIDILEAGILSPHPQTQIAAIHYLGALQDDRCDELLNKAMSSDYFFTRMEAAHQLAVRKSKNAVGQIESLMHKVPSQMRFFFPQFFALIGTSDAISLLRHMMDDSFHMTRIEAILNAARFGRDDLLPMIRARATHLNIAEQEACASAIGWLKDSKSLQLLETLNQSPTDTVQLASKRSLLLLGEESVKEEIVKMAKDANLFAITLLGDISGTEDVLYSLTQKDDLQVQFNASLALLKLNDPRCVRRILNFLLRDSRDFGFQPIYSVGNSMTAFKVIASAKQHQEKDSAYDLITLALNVREMILRECIELPEESFLEIANALFESKQTELIPLLIHLMENLQTPKVIALLKEKAETAGAPMIRAYCNLALMRLQQLGPYKSFVLNWINLKKNTEMIRFRPMLPWNVRLKEKSNPFDLTPDEHSRLLIEAYQSIALAHDENSIDIILDGLKNGHLKNRAVLAGLLIQAIQ